MLNVGVIGEAVVTMSVTSTVQLKLSVAPEQRGLRWWCGFFDGPSASQSVRASAPTAVVRRCGS
jgi:hypothetical protein